MPISVYLYSNFKVLLIVPPGHVAIVAEGAVANTVLIGAESLRGIRASYFRGLYVPAIVISVVSIPIDDSCKRRHRLHTPPR